MDKTVRLGWPAAILAAAVVTLIGILLGRALAGNGSTTLDRAILLPCTGDQEMQTLGGGVVYSDGNTLHALNAGGSQTWICAVGADMGFSVSEGGVAAWSGEKLFLLNGSTGSLYYSGTVGSTILSAKLGKTYAAVLIGTEEDATMLLLEKGGTRVDSISLSAEIAMDYGFFNDGGMFWMMTLNTQGTTPLSTISTYRPGRQLAGSVTDADQTIYRAFFQSESICAVGTTYARYYDYYGNENIDSRMLVYGWYLTAVGGSANKPLMAFAPVPQTDVSMAVSDVRLVYGDDDKTIRMPFVCSAVAAEGSTVYGVCSQYVMTYTMGNAKPVTHALPVRADRLVGITDNRALVVVSGSEVYLVPLD